MVKFTASQLECIEFGEPSTSHLGILHDRHGSHERASKPAHLVIEAGAGAGKTAVLAHRVFRKIVACPEAYRYAPHEILMATFTRAAEKELRNRVRSLLDQENMGHLASHIQISTIDSLLMALFDSIYPSFWEDAFASAPEPGRRTAAGVAQLVDDGQIASEMNNKLLSFFTALELDQLQDSVVLDFLLAGALKSALPQDLFAARPHGFARRGAREDLIAFLCSEACLLLGTQDPEIIQQSVHPGLFLLFAKLCSFAKKCFIQRLYFGRISHNDRLIFLYNVFCAPNEAKAGTVFAHADAKLPLRFKELIVDEYQDTNPAQHQLMSKLVSLAHASMVVVGDPKQSLYGFRRAKVEVFHELKKSPHWHHISLSENFRSHPELLYELNRLSHFALTYQNPDVDESFWQSAHGQAALLSKVPPAVLRAGRTAASGSQIPRVQILTHSLSKNRVEEKAVEFSFEKYSGELICSSLAKFLMQGFAHEQIVVLCETNGDCRKVHELLQNYSQVYPISSKLSSKKPSDRGSSVSPSHAQRSAITLLATLRGQSGSIPKEVSALMLFDLLASPLFGLDLEMAWRASLRLITLAQDQVPPRTPKPSKLPDPVGSFLTVLPKLQDLAQSNILAAWQILRSEIVKSSLSESKQDFYENMSRWGMAFSETFENKSWRSQIQTKEGYQGYTATFQLMSQSLLRLEPTPLTKTAETAETACVEIMTVHAAKGLQWPVVLFVPKQKETPSHAQFRCLSLSDRNVVQWLDSEKNPLEIYTRLENAKGIRPRLDDLKLKLPEQLEVIPEGKVSELNLQEAAEKMFERSRIFYTAITRAEEHLVLFTGMGAANMKNSLRDKLAELTAADDQEKFAKKITGFINWTLGSYLDEAFELRATSEHCEGKKRAPKKVPEPWLTSEVATLKEHFQSKGNLHRSVSYFDFAAPSLDERNSRCRLFEATSQNKLQVHQRSKNPQSHEPLLSSAIKKPPATESSALAILSACLQPEAEEDSWQEVWKMTMPKINKSSMPLQTEFLENATLDDETATTEKSRIANIQQGILFHAEKELDAGATDKSELATLEAISSLVLREYEIWTLPGPNEGLSRGAHRVPVPIRNVVDLICFCSLEKFRGLQAQLGKGYSSDLSAPKHGTASPFADAVIFDPFKKSDSELGYSAINDQNSSSEAGGTICIVIDYKTGQPADSHTAQMQRYMSAVSSLLRAELLCSPASSTTSLHGQAHKVLIAGYLAYVKPGTRHLRLVPVQ